MIRESLVERFGNSMRIYIPAKTQIIHYKGVNPCKYTETTLESADLHDKDDYLPFKSIIKCFDENLGQKHYSLLNQLSNTH